jgi:oxygen-dependent protoporphyrinogen oxidase
MTDRVVVVGAGVAGLTTAYRLLDADPALEVTLLEGDERAGGRLRSVRVGDLDLEAGPDSLVARKPWAAELCRELDLELVEPGASGAFAWTPRGLAPLPPTALGIPAELNELARWPGLSRAGRARAAADLVRRARPTEQDEPLGSLLRRRLGDEATEALVAPLLAGLFAGDVDRLGVRATFPELSRWEQDFGSLIRGASAALAAAREAGPMFLRPRGGMATLPGALVARIGADRIRTSRGVSAIAAAAGGFVVDAGERLPGDAVVVATPATVAAPLLADVAPDAAREAAAIEYVSTAVALLVYGDGTADALPDASGFVVPSDRAPMTAATFLSRKWPDRAFGTRAVVRCFVGAAGSEDVLEAPDDEIVEAVCRHLAALLPLPEPPQAAAVVRWPRSMPQYAVGHLERVAAIAGSLPPGIFVVGNAYGGVGVADTVREANETAERVRRYLAGRTTGSERTERVP